jgi:hypothetical protein
MFAARRNATLVRLRIPCASQDDRGGRARRQQLAEVVVSQKEIRRGDHEVAAPIRATVRDAGRRGSAVRVRAALTREMARPGLYSC